MAKSSKLVEIPTYELKENILCSIKNDKRLISLIAAQRDVSTKTVKNWITRNQKELTMYETVHLISEYLKDDDLIIKTNNNINHFTTNNH